MGALLDSIPEGFRMVLDPQQASWACQLGLGGVGRGVAAEGCRKSLTLDSGMLGFEGHLDSLAL